MCNQRMRRARGGPVRRNEPRGISVMNSAVRNGNQGKRLRSNAPVYPVCE